MHLYSIDLIPATTDAQWDCPPLPDSTSKRLLILSRPIPQGSTAETTLSRMMAACHLSPEDYELLQWEEGSSCSWTCLLRAGIAPIVLLLGIFPPELSIQAILPFYKPAEFGGRRIILSHSLQQLEQDQAAKKALWSDALKPVFAP